MSTRAIFAKSLADGTFIGGWQWNDGGSYTASELNKKLSSEEAVDKLIALGQWNVIYTKKELECHKKWCETNRNIDFTSVYTVTQIGKYYVLQDVRVATRPLPHTENYKSLEEMLEQDINFVYVFQPESKMWEKRH